MSRSLLHLHPVSTTEMRIWTVLYNELLIFFEVKSTYIRSVSLDGDLTGFISIVDLFFSGQRPDPTRDGPIEYDRWQAYYRNSPVDALKYTTIRVSSTRPHHTYTRPCCARSEHNSDTVRCIRPGSSHTLKGKWRVAHYAELFLDRERLHHGELGAEYR